MRISLFKAFMFVIGMVIIYAGLGSLAGMKAEDVSLDNVVTTFHVLLGIWFCQERYPSAPKPEEQEDA